MSNPYDRLLLRQTVQQGDFLLCGILGTELVACGSEIECGL